MGDNGGRDYRSGRREWKDGRRARRDERREWRDEWRYRRRGRSVGGGFGLIVTGCVLIALGLSFGGEWIGDSWWPWHSGPLSFRIESLADAEGGHVMGKIVTIDGTVPAGVQNIDIDLKGAALRVTRGANPSWKAIDFEEGSVDVDTSGNTLRVRGPRWRDSISFGSAHKGPKFELILPEDARFDDFVLKIGAGEVTIEDLSADSFRLEGGAGSFRAKRFDANRASVKTGAGFVELDDATVRDLRIETGAGRIVLNGDITGDADVSTGTGSVEFALAGSEEDYRIDFSRGLGSVRIGSGTWDGVGNGVAGSRDADRKIKLSTGIGAVKIDFNR